jgi:hypothetical protein
LKDGSEATINYEERPPLVIPPNKDLPPPQTHDAAIKNPNWPKDPDVARAARERKQARQVQQAGSSSEQMKEAQRPLRPDQITPNADSAPRYHRQYGGPDNTTADMSKLNNQRLSPSELGSKGFSLVKKMFDKGDDTARFTGEPPRVSLTEPPPGYQTPSPDQPYGSSKAAAAPAAENYYVTHGEADPTK